MLSPVQEGPAHRTRRTRSRAPSTKRGTCDDQSLLDRKLRLLRRRVSTGVIPRTGRDCRRWGIVAHSETVKYGVKRRQAYRREPHWVNCVTDWRWGWGEIFLNGARLKIRTLVLCAEPRPTLRCAAVFVSKYLYQMNSSPPILNS